MKDVQTATHCPWTELEPEGKGLSVHDFLTKRFSGVMGALRRQITLPYARDIGLSIGEWRLLSLIAHAGTIAFSDLVTQSASDKALVSRAVRALEKRGLVLTRPETESSKRRLACELTAAGLALHDRTIGTARARQAGILCTLSREERGQLFAILEKLQARLDQDGGPDR